MQSLLLTSFEPFGGQARNAAQDAAALLPEQIGDWRIIKRTVPTVFGASVDAVVEAICKETPDAVLMVGQAAGRSALTPERFAFNEVNARIPDNAGKQPKNAPIVANGPEAYDTTLPVENLVAAMQAVGIPSEISVDAGRFVCNELFYGVMHWLAANDLQIPAGFLHVPQSAEQAQAGQPSLPLDRIVAGLKAAIEAI